MHFTNLVRHRQPEPTKDSPVVCYHNDVDRQQTPDDEQEEVEPKDRPRTEIGDYDDVPRTASLKTLDSRLQHVRNWLKSLDRPPDLTDAEFKTFMRYSMEFFLSGREDYLWRKDPKGQHKIVIPPDRRLALLSSAHDDMGHHGFYATNALLTERYWWPGMAQDIAWFILTCRLCQLRKTQQVFIPPIVATPAPLFAKVYMDTMHLTPSAGYKYIVQGRCSLSHWPEWDMLRKESAKSLANFILHNIIYRWGTLLEIVSNNGAPFMKALGYLLKHYHIKHIRISGYNSRANGLVERSHFDVRQALFKACDGEESKWSSVAHSVFWAERVTIRR